MMDLSKLNLDALRGRLKLPALNLPLSQGRPSVALVIRPSKVQLLCLEKKQTVKTISIPVEGDTDEQILAALKKAVDEAQLKSKRVAVSVHSPEVLLRSFKMPAIPKTEWETAVPFEARKYIPFKMNELAWDFQVVGGSNLLDVIFAALPSNVCSRYSRLLEAAALQPAVIEPMGASLSRLMLSSGQPQAAAEEFACLVDVEQTRALLVIAKKGVPYFTRDVSLAASDGQVDVQRLISELRISIDFFTREHPSAAVSRVVLFGEEMLLRSWVEVMAAQLARPVGLGSSWLAVKQQETLPLTLASACGLLCPASSGAALDFLKRGGSAMQSQSKPQAPSFNLSTEDLEKIAKDPKTVTAAAVSFGAVFLAMWLFSQQQVGAVKRQLGQLRALRPEASQSLAGKDQKTLKDFQQIYKKQLALLDAFSSEQASVALRLDALARVMPEGVWLTSLTIENRLDPSGGGSMKINLGGACFLGGSGQELGAIQAFERQVRQNSVLGGNGTIQLSNIAAQNDSQRKQAYRTFLLNCQLSGKL